MKVPIVCLPFVIMLAIVSLKASTVPTASSGQSHPTSSSTEDERLRHLRADFKLMDTNGDGYLSMEEASPPVLGTVPPSVTQLFQDLDNDSDGQISFEEMVKGSHLLKNSTPQEGIGEKTQMTTSITSSRSS